MRREAHAAARRSLPRFLATLGALSALSSHAQNDPGSFEVLAASDTLKSDIYYVNARIDYRLSTEARQALESGLPLTISLEVELLNRLRLWWDIEEWTLVQRYQLEHNALTERYIVRRLNSGDQASFPTLRLALENLGRVENLPIIDAAVLDADQRYDIQIRAVLDQEQLPGPLRLLAFWRHDWALASEWYRWRLGKD